MWTKFIDDLLYYANHSKKGRKFFIVDLTSDELTCSLTYLHNTNYFFLTSLISVHEISLIQ